MLRSVLTVGPPSTLALLSVNRHQHSARAYAWRFLFRLSSSIFAIRWSCRTCEVLRTLQFDFFLFLAARSGCSFRPSVIGAKCESQPQTPLFYVMLANNRTLCRYRISHRTSGPPWRCAAFIPAVLATPDVQSITLLIDTHSHSRKS